MAKAKANLIIKKDKCTLNLIRVWKPAPVVSAKEPIRLIEGVASVHHIISTGCIHVWVNPCYDVDEIVAEIEALLAEA